MKSRAAAWGVGLANGEEPPAEIAHVCGDWYRMLSSCVAAMASARDKRRVSSNHPRPRPPIPSIRGLPPRGPVFDRGAADLRSR